MLGAIKGLGLAGSLGLLLGILIVSYIKPTEDGGIAILILIPTVIFSSLGSIVGWFIEKKNKSNTESAGQKTDDDGSPERNGD
jgi:hypothetical protein